MRECWRMLADVWIKEKPSIVLHARSYWLLCTLCVISGSICWVESLRRTDHSALTWLRRTPNPIGQQARFSIEHHPGARHGNADAMSRNYCKVRDCACHHSLAPDETKV